MREVQTGDRIGEYVLREKLGEGGFGIVWKAENPDLPGKIVAIKVARTQEGVALLKAEGEIQHKLRHPGIVPTLSLNMSHDPPYAVREFVAGPTLKEMLSSPPALPVSSVLQISGRLLEAVANAHAQGVIHGDLSPANVIVDLQGNPHLTDFGLGTGRVDQRTSLSISGEASDVEKLRGTLAYLAPERRAGLPLTPPSDVFGLGLIIMEMFTNDPVYLRFPIPGAPAWLSGIVERATARDPNTRFAYAGHMLEAFVGGLSSNPSKPIPVGTVQPTGVGLDEQWIPMVLPRTDPPLPVRPPPVEKPQPTTEGFVSGPTPFKREPSQFVRSIHRAAAAVGATARAIMQVPAKLLPRSAKEIVGALCVVGMLAVAVLIAKTVYLKSSAEANDLETEQAAREESVLKARDRAAQEEATARKRDAAAEEALAHQREIQRDALLAKEKAAATEKEQARKAEAQRQKEHAESVAAATEQARRAEAERQRQADQKAAAAGAKEKRQRENEEARKNAEPITRRALRSRGWSADEVDQILAEAGTWLTSNPSANWDMAVDSAMIPFGVPLPSNGTLVLAKGREGKAPLEIKTGSSGFNYLIRLVVKGKKEPVASLVVHDGWSTKVDVPLGNYELRYAVFKRWYGCTKFGLEAGFAKAETRLEFKIEGSQALGHSVELIRQAGGNLETTDVDADEFCADGGK